MGKKITLVSSTRYAELTGQVAAGRASYGAPLPAGWAMGWSDEWGRPYYTCALRGLTQWEPPDAGAEPASAGLAMLATYDDEVDPVVAEAAEAAVPPKDAGRTPAIASVAEGAPKSGSGKGWYYGDAGGKVQGPFPTATMLEWVGAGALPADTPICVEGGEAFTPLREATEFAHLFAQPASAPAAPEPRVTLEPPSAVVGMAAAEPPSASTPTPSAVSLPKPGTEEATASSVEVPKAFAPEPAPVPSPKPAAGTMTEPAAVVETPSGGGGGTPALTAEIIDGMKVCDPPAPPSPLSFPPFDAHALSTDSYEDARPVHCSLITCP